MKKFEVCTKGVNCEFTVEHRRKFWDGDRKVTVYRIAALVDIFNERGELIACAGEVGGFVESERNLSQEGGCWIYFDAMVYGEAQVLNDAQVIGYAEVFGRAIINNKAVISGEATVHGGAFVGESVVVTDEAIITGSAVILGNSIIRGQSIITA